MNISLLQKNWKDSLSQLLNESDDELVISSPYISDFGSNFIIANTNKKLSQKGKLRFITDLSPKNIYQGSTDPNCFKSLFSHFKYFELFHLPQLHAKVYANNVEAIVTSGNSTSGGLLRNFEYGVKISDRMVANQIKDDIKSYGELGSQFSLSEISAYCDISEEVRVLFRKKENSIREEITKKINVALSEASDKLIYSRLKNGALHTVFEKTILYLLNKYGTLHTQQLHNFIKNIHPDLCDDSVDRVINGARFGKKWKHAVRTAQQHLKRRGLVKLLDRQWRIK